MPDHTPGPWEIRDRLDSGEMIVGTVAKHVAATTPEDARLIAAAPALLAALEPPIHGFKDLPDLLEWVADRFVHVYGESPNVDFVLTCRSRARTIRAAIAAATGGSDA